MLLMPDIEPWINTRTYHFPKASLSIIEDVKSNYAYLLCGKLSDLWEAITNYERFDLLSDFSRTINFHSELNSFISELQINGIIHSDKTLKAVSPNSYLTVKLAKNTQKFVFLQNLISKFCVDNNLLPFLYLNLTYKCNLNCVHCFTPKDVLEEISYNSAKKIIDEAYELGCVEVCLSGAESTICKDFLKIAKYIRAKRIQLTILTNAQKLYDDENFFNEFINLYPSSVQISLYSMNPEIHDKITNFKGSHYKTINVIKKLRNRGLNVLISCFQTKYNLGEDKAVEEFADSVNADFKTDSNFIINLNNNNIEAKLNLDELVQFYKNTIDINSVRVSSYSKKGPICTAGIKQLCITPELNITPCNSFGYILGNYKNISITDVKNTILPEFHKMFDYKNLTNCYKYDYCKYCFYCPAYLGVGNLKLDKAPVLCEQAKAYQKALEELKKQ